MNVREEVVKVVGRAADADRENGRLVVRANLPTTLLGALGATFFVAVGAYLCVGSLVPDMFVEPFAFPSRRIVAFVVGAADLLFFGFALIFLVGRLFRFRNPIFEVGPDGILDRASALSVGFIPWEEVEDARVRRLLVLGYLAVRVRDARALLTRQGPVKRRLMGLNQRIIGTPVAVPLSALAVREEELLRKIRRHMESSAER